MKKLIALLISLCLVLSTVAVAGITASADEIFPQYDETKPSLVIGTVNYSGSGQVKLPISIENNPGIWGANFQIAYNASLKCITTTSNGIEVTLPENSPFASCMATATDNVITVFLEGNSLDADYTEDGVLCYITFESSLFIREKTFDVSFTYVDKKDIINIEGKQLELTYKNGGVLCRCEHNSTVMPAVAATCENTGLTAGSFCSRCNTVFIEQEVIPALGHNYVTKSYKTNDCDDYILETYCTKCDSKSSRTVYQVHAWKTQTVKATYFTKGNITRTCSKCNKIETVKTLKKLTLKAPTVKSKANALTVKYKKINSAKKIQVRYKINGKWKVITFSAKKKLNKTIKNLKSGKYKVQIRLMTKINGKKVYSSWSKVKKATVK